MGKEEKTLQKVMQRWIGCIVVLLLLAGCSHLIDKQEVLSAFQKMTAYEKDAIEEQKKLTEFEQKQNAIYAHMMSYGFKHFTKVAQLAKEALMNIEEREKYVAREYKAMHSAKRQLNMAKRKTNGLHDERIKQQINQFIEVAEQRYETYDKLYAEYKEMLALEKELYILLQNKDVTAERFQRQIDRINERYQNIMDINEQFNAYTEEYNREKKQLFHMWK
jgi:Putative cell-wall binding lipoprotein